MKKFGLAKGKKEDYFIIALGLALVLVVLSIVVIIANDNDQPVEQADEQSTRQLSPTDIPIPTLEPINSEPPVFYDAEAQQVLLDRKINRQPLNANDAQLKQELLALLPPGQIAGVIHESANIRVEYIEALDLFKVEILTTNIALAKDEANVWFRSQGMSQQGICDLPLGFYLNWEVANLMRNTDIIFNPLPSGCQP